MAGLTDPRRQISDDLAERALKKWSSGHIADAQKLFAEAAALEESVARGVAPSSVRVRSVLAIGAVALWYKAGDFDRAKALAYSFLADAGVSEQGARDLEQLVDRCLRDKEVGRILRDPQMIPVEIKLVGGRVGTGVAPATATKRRREAVTSLLMRAADLEAKQPYRERGPSELDRSDEIQIFEATGRAASFGLSFFVASGTQQIIQETRSASPEKVVHRFFAAAAAAESSPKELQDLMPDNEYARAFLEGFSEIAPDGTEVGEVLCTCPTWKMSPGLQSTFAPSHREALRGAARALAKPGRVVQAGETTHEGRLVGLRLHGAADQWIELEKDGEKEPMIILLEGDRLKKRMAALLESRVRVFSRYVQKRRRHVALDVTSLLGPGADRWRRGSGP